MRTRSLMTEDEHEDGLILYSGTDWSVFAPSNSTAQKLKLIYTLMCH